MKNFCAVCGIRTYDTIKQKQHNTFCSPEHRRQYHQEHYIMKFPCLVCGREVERAKNLVLKRGYRFCGKECAGKWRAENPAAVQGNHTLARACEYVKELLDPTYEREKRKVRPTFEATRKKMSDAGKLKVFSQEHRDNISKACKGRKNPPITEETRKKLSTASTGRKHTEKVKNRISESKMGHAVSEATREKISKTLQGQPGRPHSEETKKKMSKSAQGRKMSLEAIIKRTATRKRNATLHAVKLT